MSKPPRPAIHRLLAALALAAAALLALFASPAFATPPTTICSEGSAAGQCTGPHGVATDPAGNLYVADYENKRIDEFSFSGAFIRAFGWGVLNGAAELQSCTSSCRAGVAGSGAGAVRPLQIAVDPASGDLYVSESSSGEDGGVRVQKFSPSGQFLLMFGGEVDKTTHANLCTKADLEGGDVCGAGVRGTAPGFFEVDAHHYFYFPIAVDPSSHEVLAGDLDRIQRFSEAGAQLSELALPGAGNLVGLAVAPASGDIYTIEESIQEVQQLTPPASGTYTLSFEGQTTVPLSFDATPEQVAKALKALSTIGPDNLGGVIAEAGDKIGIFFAQRLEKNTPQIVASAGSVTTIQEGSPSQLRKREASGTPIEALDAAGHPQALGLDAASGDLYVSDQLAPTCGCHGQATLLGYNSSGIQTSAFGGGQVLGGPTGNSLAFGASTQRLYVANNTQNQSAVQSFPLPAPGPLLREGSLKAVPRPATATLKATITPEGAETHYRFQYVSQKDFEEEGGWSGPHVTTTPPAVLLADFTEHEAKAVISGLTSETAYRFRVFAENENGEGNVMGEEEASFETLPPVVIDSESVTAVSASSATLQAEINTLGEADLYRFEYLSETQYLENLANSLEPFAGASLAPVPDAPLDAVEADQPASQAVSGLQPRTAYRYRVFAHGPGGSKAGPALAFTTQPLAASGLPDRRGWELVSPPDKHGAILYPIAEGLIQASASGEAITYAANSPTEASPPGFSQVVQVLSRRAGPPAAPWLSADIATPHSSEAGFNLNGPEYKFFGADLSQGLVVPKGPFTALSPEATERTPYLRTDFSPGEVAQPCASACYRPLVDAANVPLGTEFGEVGVSKSTIEVEGASPDASHVVLRSQAPLTAGAPPEGAAGTRSLYEWAEGRLQLLSVKPAAEGGAPISPAAQPNLGSATGTSAGQGVVARNAISADGSRVVFSEFAGNHRLYLRDTEAGHEETLRLDAKQGGSGKGAAAPFFQAASTDGSRVFFTDTQQLTPGASATGADLYECEVLETEAGLQCALHDLTPEAGGQASEVLGLLTGVSEDGSSVYFLANGALAPGARHGSCLGAANGVGSPNGAAELQPPGATCNLYLRAGGQTRLIAVLSGADFPDWFRGSLGLLGLTDRVSPNGRFLAFMSSRPLTGYDNRDAATGKPDEEVFLYDAAANGGEGKLVCASCDPTGARPRGLEYVHLKKIEGGRAGGERVWPDSAGIAANVPGWTAVSLNTATALYQSRYLSDSGRLFFNSPDALVPADSNGTEDVYQYEPPVGGETEPPGDTCAESSPTFSHLSGGCLDLVSSGASSEESSFMDASETGNDVFFLTSSRLSGRDEDTAGDLYDARVNGGEAQAARPVECSGDACQQPATPPFHPTPGTSTLNGPENLRECPRGRALKGGKCVAKKRHHKKKRKKHSKQRTARHNRGGSK